MENKQNWWCINRDENTVNNMIKIVNHNAKFKERPLRYKRTFNLTKDNNSCNIKLTKDSIPSNIKLTKQLVIYRVKYYHALMGTIISFRCSRFHRKNV